MRLTAGAAGTALLAAGLTGGVQSASAEPANAECNNNTARTGYEAWASHEEIGQSLDRLEHQRGDVIDVEVAGTSNQGRELWTARVGSGDTAVLITSQIHGDEPSGTVALLRLLRDLTANTAAARQLRSELTVVAIPQMNPDGAALDRRPNDRSWDDVVADFPQLAGAEPAWNYYNFGPYADQPGFDVNRDYHPALDDYVPQPGDFPGSSSEPGWFIQSEAQTVRDVYVDLTEEFGVVDTYVDLHHQGACYVDEDGESYVTMSLSGKFVADPSSPEGSEWSEYAASYRLDYAKQLNVAAYDELTSYGQSPFGNTTLYPQGINLPGTGLGSFALNGSGAVLFEVRGQTDSWGAKKRGQLVRTVERGLEGMLDAVASGAVHDIDPDRYDDIPLTDR